MSSMNYHRLRKYFGLNFLKIIIATERKSIKYLKFELFSLTRISYQVYNSPTIY
jgi:hypothetical protein